MTEMSTFLQDDPCPDCGHGVDGYHDPANYCLHDDHGPEGADEPCDIRYDSSGNLVMWECGINVWESHMRRHFCSLPPNHEGPHV